MSTGKPTRITESGKADDNVPPEAQVSANDLTPRQPFSRDILWTLGARLLMVANSVGTGVIVARWLGATGLGAYAALNVASGTAVQIGGAGLTAANIYFISRDPKHLKPVFGNAVVFALLGGSALAIVLIALASFAPALFTGIPLRFVAITAAVIPFQLLVLFGLNVFLARGRVGTFNLLDAIGQSFLIINAVLTLVIAGAGLVYLLSVNTAAGVGMGVLISWLVYRHVALYQGSAQQTDVRLFKSMVRYGLKFNVSMASTMLVFRVDLLIVNYFRGTAEAGVYSVASQGGLLLMLLPNVIGSLLFPRVASMRDMSGEFTAVVTRHTAFALAIAVVLAIPGAFVLPYLYGAPFSDAPVQLLILLPGVYLMGLEMVMVQHFVGTGLPAAIPMFWVMTLFFNIALNLMIVPAYGARGASLVSTFSYALIFALVFFYFRAKTHKRFADTFILRPIELRPLFAAAARLFSSTGTKTA
jgi:O-antigen/teichoic acid export membrane protein